MSGKWFAWHDTTPGRLPMLYVTGELTVPHGGQVVLRRSREVVAPPEVIVLELVFVRSEDGHRPGPGTVPVRYEEITGTHYQSIRIDPDGLLINVEDIVS